MERRIKLLHVLYSGQGGLGTYFINFVRSDNSGKFEHFAFFYGIEPLFEEYEEFCKANSINYIHRLRRTKLDFDVLLRLSRFASIQSVNYVLLHTLSLTPILAIALFKPWKVITFDHTSHFFKTRVEKVHTLLNHLFAFRMVFFYEQQFQNIKHLFPLLYKGKRSVVISKSVDVNRLKPEESRPANKEFTLGITSRIITGKRHDILIEAVRLLAFEGINVRLKIAGDGPLRNLLQDKVDSQALADKVEFVGLLTQDELVDFYKHLDAYVHATNGETICFSIMEAQACGLPILASDVSGVNTTLVNGRDGLLFDNNAVDVKKSIKRMAQDPSLAKKMGKRSRANAVLNFENNNPSELFYSTLGSN